MPLPDPEPKGKAPPAGGESRRGWRNWGDHPIVAVITVLASIAGILGYFKTTGDRRDEASMSLTPNGGVVEAPSGAGSCTGFVGRWDWLTTGGVVAIAENGTMVWYRLATDATPTITGSWECRQDRTRHVTMRWIQTGLVDTLVLSADGSRVSGANLSSGFKLSGTRAR